MHLPGQLHVGLEAAWFGGLPDRVLLGNLGEVSGYYLTLPCANKFLWSLTVEVFL